MGALRRAGYDAGRTPPYRTVHHEFVAPSWSTIGGLRVGMLNVTYPFGRLTVDAEWCQLRVRGLGALMGDTWIARGEVWQVRQVGRGISPGFMFDSADGRFDGVIFWSLSPDEVRQILRAAGWPLEPPGGPVASPIAMAAVGGVGAPGPPAAAGRPRSRAHPWLWATLGCVGIAAFTGVLASGPLRPISSVAYVVLTLGWVGYWMGLWRRFDRRHQREVHGEPPDPPQRRGGGVSRR